ncbi:LytR C-terminal domain-containing protein [Saccharothrix variisporea]|uniref:LytR cell envelope-related transcriptional attenuator n=1 Tax=Saccharothrix variisporea TaxID=543527 RepID=A0A495XD89_9PSEU|nr:LytR C-terminal domain-containing protein [Saccharothrix variisporea]RKT71085.1 LytR cell envelope-related transcriptional attenuator [Saccharothrix variisporea]
MSSPEPARSAHPARAAGLALIGVAALALVIGVASLFTGGDDDQPGAQPPGSSSETATTGSPGSESPSSTSSRPQPTTTAPTTPAPTSTTGVPAGAPTTTPPPPVTPTTKPPVRVYNNGTIANLAARASEDVRKVGWDVVETGNYSQGVIPTTTVYFRPGTDEEASAQQLAQALRAEVKPRFDGIEGAHPGIIVIVTNDYQGPSGKI